MKNILIIFGGKSTEHEVSRVSACMIIENIDKSKYNVLLIGITKNGKWLMYEDYNTDKIKDGTWENEACEVYTIPKDKGCFTKIKENKIEIIDIDLVFDIIHGNTGEDGKMQGMLEILGIPYVGSKTTSSAICMDKAFTKIIVDSIGVCQAEYVIIKQDYDINLIEEKIGYPCFIKPANGGSSLGINKANDRVESAKAINEAFNYDKKLVIEKAINGREVECAVLGNNEIRVSTVGEITYATDFYDYNAKYERDDSKVILPADLSSDTITNIRDIAEKIYKVLDCQGLARIDFFVEKDTDRVVFNEVNTLPGFTKASMYPMLWEHEGVSKQELIDILIQQELGEGGIN